MNHQNLGSSCPSKMFLQTSAKHAQLSANILSRVYAKIPGAFGSPLYHLFSLCHLIKNPPQDFKSTLRLRDDAFDYSTYTANSKRKRPTPTKGRKSTTGGDEEDNSGRKGSYSRQR